MDVFKGFALGLVLGFIGAALLLLWVMTSTAAPARSALDDQCAAWREQLSTGKPLLPEERGAFVKCIS